MRIGPTTQFCTRDKVRTLLVPEHLAHLLVLDLGQRRVHHQDQADGDWYVRCTNLETVDESLCGGHEIPRARPRNMARKIHRVR